MTQNNLYKGFEVELFTGSLNSHIGVSAEIEKKFKTMAKEKRINDNSFIYSLF